MSENKEIVTKFWNAFGEARFADARPLLHPNIVVYWPNTREMFKGRDRFIRANEEYPGRWVISLARLVSENDTVVSVVYVESADRAASFYATSFFTFRDGLITEITEYWSDCGEPPAWRIEKGLSERY